MKTPSDQLFRLVQAMTSAEKRYFKKDNKQNRTVDLFDILNNMDTYDEEEVKKRLKDASYAKNLKIHKNRLQQLILKSLRNYHDESNAEYKIRTWIGDAIILIKKKMYVLANQYLQKAKKACKQHELYEHLLLILGIEARMASHFDEMKEQAQHPIEQMQECIDLINNYTKYAQLNQQALYNIHSKPRGAAAPSNQAYLHELVQKYIISPELQPLSPVAERMHNHIMALWYGAQNRTDLQYKYTLASLTVFEKNPYIMKEKSKSYLNCIINHLGPCIREGKHAEILDWRVKSEEWIAKYPHLQPYLIYIYYFQLESWALQFEFEKYTDFFIRKIHEEALDSWEDQYITQKIYFKAIEPFMALKDYGQTGKLILKILDNKNTLSTEWLYAIYLLELVYHFEQGDFVLMESLIAAHQKRLQRSKNKDPLLLKTLHLFKKLAAVLPDQYQELFSAYFQEMEAWKGNAYFETLSTCFHYQHWVYAKAHKMEWKTLLTEGIQEGA